MLSYCCLFLAEGGPHDICRSTFLSTKSEETCARRAADAAMCRPKAPVAALRLWSAYKACSSSDAAAIVAVARAATIDWKRWNHQLVCSVLVAITCWSACSRNKTHLLVLRSSSRARLPVSAPALRLPIFQSTCLLPGAQTTPQALFVKGYSQQALRSAAVQGENLAAFLAGPAVAAVSATTLRDSFTAAAAGFLVSRQAMPTGAPASVARLCSAADRTSSRADFAKSPGAVAACHAEGSAASCASPAASSAAGAAVVVGRGCAPVPTAADLKLYCTRCFHDYSPPEDMEILSFRRDSAQRLDIAETAAAHGTVCAITVPARDIAGLSLKKVAPDGSSLRQSAIAITARAAETLSSELAGDFSDERGAEEDPVAHCLTCVWAAADPRGTSRLEETHERLQRLSLCSGSPSYGVVFCRQCISGVTPEISAAFADGGEAAEVYGVGSFVLRAHHNRKRNKLGRPYGHRRCLLRNLCTQLLKYGSIVTTLARAKECKRSMDKVLMLCKQPSLHTYRQALGFFYDKRLCRQLFIEAPERFAYRPHGFCRIEKMPFCRLGDNAEMARVELAA